MTSWDRAALDTLPATSAVLRRDDAGWSAYRRDVVLVGAPDAVVRPGSEGEIRAILEHAHHHRIPVTCAGGQTSLTGSSVAEEGLLLATERLDAIGAVVPDPGTGGMTATAGPGIFLGDFQRALEREGWFYPPDPTSRNEARLGATVATNATGEDTLRYGPTRNWIRGLRVVTADGAVRTLRRSPASHPAEEKATAGYYLGGEEIDLVIGSEGTLGVITEVTVDVIPRPPVVFAGLAFFSDLLAALRFVVAARSDATLEARALELVDRAALDMVGANPEGVTWPTATGAAIYFKGEAVDEADRDRRLEAWLTLIEGATPAPLAEATVVVADAHGRDRLREFRHRVPATLHERVEPFRERGGGKIGTDWWVPWRELPGFLVAWRDRVAGSGLEAVIFGHVGNGHPHVNFLPRDADETARARKLVRGMCEEAVKRGGGVAGEHGIGKVKRDLLGLQYPSAVVERMIAEKRRWDPRWILGRGNLFSIGTDS